MRLPYGWEIRDWISKKCFPDRPAAATLEEWGRIRRKHRLEHPIKFWINNDFVHFFTRQANRIDDIKHGFMYRFIKAHKYHLVDTGLGYGYHGNDRIMLHANFSILKDFVEVEKASQQYCWKDEPKITEVRVAALKYLDWECELRLSEDELPKGDPRIGDLTSQAVAARETRKLYLWWVDERPARPDPYDVFPNTKDEDDSVDWLERYADRTEEDHVADSVRFNRIRELEAKYEAEDTTMMIRLIRIRKTMWS